VATQWWERGEPSGRRGIRPNRIGAESRRRSFRTCPDFERPEGFRSHSGAGRKCPGLYRPPLLERWSTVAELSPTI